MRKFKNNKLIVATHNLGKYEEICDLFSEDLKLSRFSPLPTARLACASIPM